MLGAAALVAALLVVLVAVVQPSGSRAVMPQTTPIRTVAPRERLPDLDQEAPSELRISTGIVRGFLSYRLGFRSAVRNIGAGPLIVMGTRHDARVQFMTVRQLINRAGAPRKVVRGVGRMRFVISRDHRHWHYLQFDRYELRHAVSGQPVVRDRKTGFCLGDRYRAARARAAPSHPVYTGRCGLGQRGRLRMGEGISVGYGDDYSAFLEGQELPLDDLPGGRYVLVHHVNVDRRLKELSYVNNAASLLLDLRWSRGAPHMRVLATCPETDRCTEGSSDQ
jgi:hypothetical protein